MILYGPFKIGNKHISQSNELFDASLKNQNKSWGVRDLGEVSNQAQAQAQTVDATASAVKNVNAAIVITENRAAISDFCKVDFEIFIIYSLIALWIVLNGKSKHSFLFKFFLIKIFLKSFQCLSILTFTSSNNFSP